MNQRLRTITDRAETAKGLPSLTIKNATIVNLFGAFADLVAELEAEGGEFSSSHLVSNNDELGHVESVRLDLPNGDFVFIEATTRPNAVNIEIQYSIDGKSNKPRRSRPHRMLAVGA